MEIKALPEIPQALMHDAASGKVVPFVGAGASRLAGCPGWDELAKSALEHLAKKKLLTWAEIEHIRRLPNVRTQLSIAKHVADAGKEPIPFARLLPFSRDHKDGMRLYAAIAQLGRRFVTTNFDPWLDKDCTVPAEPRVTAAALGDPAAPPVANDRDVVYRQGDLEIKRFQDGTVMHLHGSVLDPESMILSTEDYLKRYASDRADGPENKTLTFLRYLFTNHSVLFIGYGIEEPEILEFLLTKQSYYPAGQVREERRYVLAPFFSFEAQLAGHLRAYWSGFNVELIPFLRDDNSYSQLIEVIEYLARTLPRPSAEQLRKLTNMEGLLP